ncbi:MAG: hypothetical protein AB8B80_13450 [Marinicellaceae bacterium]
MNRVKIFVSIFVLTMMSFVVAAKKDEPDQIKIVQGLISDAYQKGYIDAAPVEMDFIEKKVIKAREARDNRKRKDFDKLIAEIKADLKIVKQRHEVNALYNKLSNLEQKNVESERILDDLKRQLK